MYHLKLWQHWSFTDITHTLSKLEMTNVINLNPGGLYNFELRAKLSCHTQLIINWDMGHYNLSCGRIDTHATSTLSQCPWRVIWYVQRILALFRNCTPLGWTSRRTADPQAMLGVRFKLPAHGHSEILSERGANAHHWTTRRGGLRWRGPAQSAAKYEHAAVLLKVTTCHCLHLVLVIELLITSLIIKLSSLEPCKLSQHFQTLPYLINICYRLSPDPRGYHLTLY